MSERTIKQLETQEMVERIHKDEKSSFSVFLSLELKERYLDRPVEEAHLGFDHWRKLLMLREEKKSELQKLRDSQQQHLRWLEQKRKSEQAKLKRIPVNIPEWMKQASTKYLLALRFTSYPPQEFNTEALYAELATREHVPSKLEAKEKRREAAKKNKKWVNSREIHNIKKLENGSNKESEQDS